MPEPLPKRLYSNNDCVRFEGDMEAIGLEVQHYRGRFFWEGPAVVVRQDFDNERARELASVGMTPEMPLNKALNLVMHATQVEVQWDNMGLGWIVYPVARDAGFVIDE